MWIASLKVVGMENELRNKAYWNIYVAGNELIDSHRVAGGARTLWQ